MTDLFRKTILSNGLTVLSERMAGVRSVAIGVWLGRGSRHETAPESGLSHFIEHMVFKGTARRSQAQIAQELDAIGGQTDAFTSHEYAGFHAKVLDEHVPQAIDLLSDIVLAPRFDEEELERERNVIFEEIRSVEDAPEELVHDLFSEAFWPEHPLGRPILGTPETVARFSRQDLLGFFRRTYSPSHLIVAAAGNLDHERLLALVRERFSGLEAPADGKVTTRPGHTARVRIVEKDLEQAHLVLGTSAPAKSSPDRFAAHVLNAILGGNLSSRLFQVIREERGLAYTVYSSVTSYSDTGQFTVYAGTNPNNVSEVVDLVLGELRKIRDHAVASDELQRAKDHLRGSILMALESTDARMSQLARQELYHGRPISAEEAIRSIDAVSPDDIARLSAAMFGEGPLAMTALGRIEPSKAIPERLVA